MRAHRNLVLRKETLTELQSSDLAAVGAGNFEPDTSQIACIHIVRPSGQLINCSSIFDPCTSGCFF